MNAQTFVNNLKKLRDPVMIELLTYQKASPITEPDKFMAYRKKPFDAVKYMKPILYSYILSTCSGKAMQMYPQDIVKQIQTDLELRKQSIPKISQMMKTIQVEISDKEICKLACQLGSDCFRDNAGNANCKQNFCKTCKSYK